MTWVSFTVWMRICGWRLVRHHRAFTRAWASKEMHLRVCDNPVAHHLHGQES